MPAERLPLERRTQLEALLAHWNDWIPVPGQQWDDTEPLLDASERRRESEYEVRERYRRYEARLELADRLRAGLVDAGERTALEAARAEHSRSGSYQELERAMRHLRRRQPYSYWVLHRRYVDGVPFLVDAARLEACLVALSDLLPERLRAPERVMSEAERRAERDALIRVLAGEGWSLRRIAKRVGLSHERVRGILARQQRDTAP